MAGVAGQAVSAENTIMPIHTKPYKTCSNCCNGCHTCNHLDWKFNAKDAFFRIRIPVGYRHLTAFQVRGQAYQFRRMPFGLKTAPATYQRFMDWGLSALDWCCYWYIDDVLIFANTPKDLIHREGLVRKKLREMGTEIAEQKSVGKQKSLLYAGLWVTGIGIGPNLSKVREILAIKAPTTKAEAQSALGLVSYLRDFIPLATHFTAQLYPDQQGLKLSDAEYASQWSRLKQHLASSLTINHHWRDDVDADVYTDASQHAIGVVVLQEGKIVCLASRKLTPAETRYSATDREHLGLVYCADKFKLILHQNQATTRVWSDHSALLGRKAADLTPRQARWLEKCRTWIPNLLHVPGKRNPADFVSR